jgi:energy-coupling factor transporter ATP-binding protein EcfA2
VKLSEIRTHKLFGLFDHVIPLNQEDRITIIHGPNGYGKTAVLRIVAGILQAKYSVLRSLPFEQIDLCFDNGRVLTVKKRSVAGNRSSDGPETHQVVFEYAPDGQFVLPRFPRGLEREAAIRRLQETIPDLVRLDVDQWRVATTGEVLQLDDLIDRFGEELGGQDQSAEQPNWLTSLRESVSVRFIQANRLEIPEWAVARVGRAFTARSVVAKFARELAVRIQGTLADYAELSQSLDRSFPSRLVATPPDLKMSTEQVRTKLTDLEKKRIRLTDAGLLDKNGQSHFELPSVIDDSKIDVLSVYIRDVELKLSVSTSCSPKSICFAASSIVGSCSRRCASTRARALSSSRRLAKRSSQPACPRASSSKLFYFTNSFSRSSRSRSS